MKLTDNIIDKNRSCSNLPKLNRVYNNAYHLSDCEPKSEFRPNPTLQNIFSPSDSDV